MHDAAHLPQGFPEVRIPWRIDDGIGARIGEREHHKGTVERAVQVGSINEAEVEGEVEELIGCPANDEGDDDDEEHFDHSTASSDYFNFGRFLTDIAVRAWISLEAVTDCSNGDYVSDHHHAYGGEVLDQEYTDADEFGETDARVGDHARIILEINDKEDDNVHEECDYPDAENHSRGLFRGEYPPEKERVLDRDELLDRDRGQREDGGADRDPHQGRGVNDAAVEVGDDRVRERLGAAMGDDEDRGREVRESQPADEGVGRASLTPRL